MAPAHAKSTEQEPSFPAFDDNFFEQSETAFDPFNTSEFDDDFNDSFAADFDDVAFPDPDARSHSGSKASTSSKQPVRKSRSKREDVSRMDESSHREDASRRMGDSSRRKPRNRDEPRFGSKNVKLSLCISFILIAVYQQLHFLLKVSSNEGREVWALEKKLQKLENDLQQKKVIVEELQNQTRTQEALWQQAFKDLRYRLSALEKPIHQQDSSTLHRYPTFPVTKFTAHVKEVVAVIEHTTLNAPEDSNRQPFLYNPSISCSSFHIVVDQPFSPPTKIECTSDVHSQAYCIFFQHIFQNKSRILPYNVTVGASYSDKLLPGSRDWGQCLGSSSPDGLFAMTNFQDIKRQAKQTLQAQEIKHQLPFNDWHIRQSIPVFRGSPRITKTGPWTLNPEKCPKRAEELNERLKAAAFSLMHPDLLDAVVQPQDDGACVQFNATNGLDELFRWGEYASQNVSAMPPVKIDPTEYYTKYQTVLVLGGIGAAFRTTRHLSAGQCVILQDFEWKEWFTPLMKPHVHYIPVKEDLSDLKEVMEWIREHPRRVRKIAETGHQFYRDYLSSEPNNEHWYELLWSLSLLIHEQGPERLKTGSGKEVWIGPQPVAFHRTTEAEFEKTDPMAIFTKKHAFQCHSKHYASCVNGKI